MSGPDDQERAKELGRLWQGAVLPMEDEGALQARRARVVPTLGGAIGRAAERRQRERSFRRVISTLAVAAGAVGAVSAGYALTQNHRARAVATHATGPDTGPRAAAPHVARSGVRAVSGVVTLMHESQQSIVDRAALTVGDSVSTADGAEAEVALTDLVVAAISGGAELDVVAPRGAFHRLRLDRGRLDARVDDTPSTTPKLVVETPDVEVVVTGTVFEVDVTRVDPSAPSVTRVSVTKGRVVVKRAGVEVAAVTAGQAWASGGPAPGAVPPAARAPSPPLARPPAAPKSLAGLSSTGELAPVQVGTLGQENALFQAAIAARSGGDETTAAERLGVLLTRYPGSPLASEARVERMRALARSGQGREAAREARRYLADHPDGFAREEAKRLVMAGDLSK